MSASGKKIDVVTHALNALVVLNSAAQAAAIAPSATAPASPATGLASPVFGGYHEEADSIIAQANDHYQQ